MVTSIMYTCIRGFSESSIPQYAIHIFIEMLKNSQVQPHLLTYPSAYARGGLAINGAQIHGRIIKLLSCCFLVEARELFNEDEIEDVVSWNFMIIDASWNSIISGFVRNEKWNEALELFSTMQEENIKPSEFTLVSLLNACGHSGALEPGN
uniref:Pentatricopeptide repeat-containing protein n=1 Tax=Solanum lycopersicum TaxID=4081 RepID=A0A3Q7IWB7_SOLLC